jgi:hypothetical protein
MDTMIPKAAMLMVLLAVAAPLPAQISSSAAAVTLHARVEESVSVRAFPISMVQTLRDGAQSNPVALNVLLDWRLQGARIYRVGYGLEADDEPSRDRQHPRFFSLRQLEANAAGFSFLSASNDQPIVLGVWGDTNRAPSGMASLLLRVPSSDGDTTATLRITVAVF